MLKRYFCGVGSFAGPHLEMKLRFNSPGLCVASLAIIILLTSLTAQAQRISGNRAAQLVERCADKLRKADGLQVTFTATADGLTRPGELVMKGRMFTLSSGGDMMTWFDGKTQWTYSRQIGEVNIVTPTPDEVRAINPLSIIGSFSSSFSASSLSPSQVQLSPLKGYSGDIRRAVITFDLSTLYPTEIVLTMSNRQQVTLKITRIATTGKLPASAFRFDSKKFPGVQVVDLR